MLTDNDIDKFYKDFEDMKLTRPNATMKKASGMSSGNVSEYLNRKKTPSEAFIKSFYEKVYKPSTIVPRETQGLNVALSTDGLTITLKDYIEQLQRDKKYFQDLVKSRVENIDANLNTALAGVTQLSLHVESAREVVLASLARLEKKPKGSLAAEADKIVIQLMKERRTQGSSADDGR